MRFDACRPRTSINGRELTEKLASRHLAKAYGLTQGRVDGDANFAQGQEEHVIRGVEIIENRLSRRVALPDAAPFDLLDRRRREVGKNGDTLERIVQVRGTGPCHRCADLRRPADLSRLRPCVYDEKAAAGRTSRCFERKTSP